MRFFFDEGRPELEGALRLPASEKSLRRTGLDRRGSGYPTFDHESGEAAAASETVAATGTVAQLVRGTPTACSRQN